ncbi:phosphoribosyltransferase [Stackebrandtia nassauensis DSM 44728]|uniref:Phosphoribosyltransferase n=1 Tax=Stackebrandtia nassauensis (strain DSM 44728 / CIP 108903 / NRRL B-16338 / NBRC 102104 / LLR-40K-21) TaxID=446470 RepID=D3Q2U8_STANL|nr:phosphoribosyltransferase [Stackebrandtia nassauensis DSM 44728]
MTAAEAARRRLRETTVWSGDRLATLHWWSDAELLRLLGPALAELHAPSEANLVAGAQSSGYLLAPLTATTLGVGMLGIQKLPRPDGSITLATATEMPGPGDRVLLVDDVVETGAQALAIRDLVTSTGAEWLGAAAMVTYRDVPGLNLKALVHIDELRYGSFLDLVVDLCAKPAMLGSLTAIDPEPRSVSCLNLDRRSR